MYVDAWTLAGLVLVAAVVGFVTGAGSIVWAGCRIHRLQSAKGK